MVARSILKLVKDELPKVEYIDYKDKIELYYKNSKGGQPKAVIVKKYLSLDESFFEGLGLYIGECERSKSGKALSFTNTNIDILRFIILWLDKYFGIEKKELSVTIISPKVPDTEYLNKKWSQILDLDNSQFTKPSFPISNPGNLERARIFRNKILYRVILESTFRNILPLCFMHIEWGNGFLRGYYAAEGYPLIRKRRLGEVSVASKDLEVLTIVKRLLLNRGILSNIKRCEEGRNKDGQYELKVFSFKSFKKLDEINLFKLHDKRKALFIEGLSKFKYAGMPESGQTG